MTQKEKARAYDAAIERAKELLGIGLKDTRDKRVVLSFFPELKESEDERIKEAIIATIHLYYGEPLEDEAKEMIAWLEKQGQKPTWSEEDEVKINRIVACLENLNVADNDMLLKDVEWLKSFKERIGG